MSFWPAALAGVVAVIEVALATDTPLAATPPIETVAPAVNPVPEIVMASPPVVGPAPGKTVAGEGAGNAAAGGGCDDGPAGDDPPHDMATTLTNVHTNSHTFRFESVCIASSARKVSSGPVQPVRHRRSALAGPATATESTKLNFCSQY